MNPYKNKLKRDIIGSNTSPTKYGVYTKAIRNYKKGEEIFIGTITQNNKELFDSVVKIIK